MSKIKPTVLTVAGSDSGGGAGIQADLRTFNALQVYGCSVITAVTAQNPYQVSQVDVLPASAVRAQFQSVLEVFPVRFAKTGMLANREIIETVAELVKKYDLQLVVDPVMVSTSGAKLLETSAISAMRDVLFPAAAWLTPNIPEAELICGRKLVSFDELVTAALELHRKFHCNVILKSGHRIEADKVTDVVCCNGDIFTLSSPAVEVRSETAHGTGCTLSSALTALLASGKSPEQALTGAKDFVYGSLAGSVALSDELAQMYPPEKEYSGEVVLVEY